MPEEKKVAEAEYFLSRMKDAREDRIPFMHNFLSQASARLSREKPDTRFRRIIVLADTPRSDPQIPGLLIALPPSCRAATQPAEHPAQRLVAEGHRLLSGDVCATASTLVSSASCVQASFLGKSWAEMTLEARYPVQPGDGYSQ